MLLLLQQFTLKPQSRGGSVTLVGTTASLLFGRKVVATPGSFQLDGSADLLQTRRLSASTGSFTFSGVSASLLKRFLLAGSAGSFALVGPDVTLSRHLVLAVAPASCVVSGIASDFLFNRNLVGSFGALTLSGLSVDLLHSIYGDTPRAYFVAEPHLQSFRALALHVNYSGNVRETDLMIADRRALFKAAAHNQGFKASPRTKGNLDHD